MTSLQSPLIVPSLKDRFKNACDFYSCAAYHRVLKVARTIADLAGEQPIAGAHIAEAIQFRRFDRG